MRKSHFLISILISTIMLVSGYLYGRYEASKEMYLNFILGSAINSVLPTQVLYTIKSDQTQDSVTWLENEICSNLFIIGSALDEYPELSESDVIKNVLSMPRQYSADYETEFCSDALKDAAVRALDLANDPETTYRVFFNKYRKVDKSLNTELSAESLSDGIN